MSLTLVTGPANAAKAGVVLGAFRAADDPLLVVPTAADVEPYQRELAASGAVFGSEVLTFTRLLGVIARRTGYRGRRLGFLARDRVVASAIASASLRALGDSARTPGFARAAGRLFSELQAARVTPQRLIAGLRTLSGSDHHEDVGALYAAYVHRLEALDRVDPEGFAWGALQALQADPSRWGGRPVFLYGFDDLTPTQLATVEALAGPCATDVTLSLTWEEGRAALASRAQVMARLRELATSVSDLPARSEFATPALHHLERHLFAEARPQRPNGAVRLLEAGGERAEAELIGAALLELVEAGAAPGDIAVLVRTPEQAPLLAQTLSSYGLPVERAERVRLRETRLGAGLLAYGAAALGGTAADLLTWLRTPGKMPAPEAVDAIEQRLRRAGVAGAAEAVSLLEAPAIAADLATARDADGAAAFLDVLQAELEAIWTAPYRRQAAVMDADGLADAAVARELRFAARELRQLADSDPGLVGSPQDILAALAAVEIRAAAPSGAGILLADPLAVRARRFRVVVVCGLQDGAFPKHAAAEPFLDDAERRALASSAGIVLPLHEDVMDRERYLFYAAVSRAEEVLFLSFRASDEEGEPELRSPFVDDVADLFTEDVWTQRGRRLLAEVTWPPAQAPTPLELRRAQAAAAPVRAEAGPLPAPGPELFAVHDRESARGLEAYAACGVRWLVERVLRPRRLEPDPEPLTRGSLAHSVLEQALRSLKADTGSAALTPATREAASGAPARRDRLRPAHPRGRARARGPARARGRARPLARPRVRARAGLRAGVARVGLRRAPAGRSHRHRRRRSHRCRARRRDRARLQGEQGLPSGQVGRRRAPSGSAVRARRARAAGARRRRGRLSAAAQRSAPARSGPRGRRRCRPGGQ